jgi:hypothetical protein
MENIHTLISELDQYCEATGLSAVTVCNYATKNPRLYDRLVRRAEQTDDDAAALRAYMLANPPKGGAL